MAFCRDGHIVINSPSWTVPREPCLPSDMPLAGWYTMAFHQAILTVKPQVAVPGLCWVESLN